MGQVSLHCSDPLMVLILLSFPFQNPELWVSFSTFYHNPRDSISQIFFSKGCCSTGLHGCKVIPWNHIFYFIYFLFIILSIYFWLCWVFIAVQAFSSCSEQRLLFTAVHRLLVVVASFISKHRLQGTWASITVAPGLQNTGSIVVVHRLRWSMACGLFPDRRSNLCLLHWQADSLPLSH